MHICCLDLLPTAITLSVSRPSEQVSATEGDKHTVLPAKNATGNETKHHNLKLNQSKSLEIITSLQTPPPHKS